MDNVSASVSELLNNALDKNGDTSQPIVLDFSNVRELSFANLRQLLGVAQGGRAVQLINVAPNVLSRIQDSGVGSILDANPTPTPITLDGWRKTGEGFTADSYFNQDGDRMLKLFKDFIPASDAIAEKRCARAAVCMGVPTPVPGELVSVGPRGGVIFELLREKKSVARAIADDPTHAEDYIARYAAAAKKLHAIPCNKTVFGSAHDRARAMVSDSPLIDSQKKVDVIRFLDKIEDTDTCLQGDFQIGNAVISAGQMLFIDLGMFAYGNPLYDLGFLYFTGHNGNAKYADLLNHNTPENLLATWFLFIRHYFGVSTEKDVAEIDEMVAPFGGLSCLTLGAVDPHAAENLFPFIKEHLLDRV